MPSTKSKSTQTASSTKTKKKVALKKEPKVAAEHVLKLSDVQLTHVRDVMSVIITSKTPTRISESLAETQKRSNAEADLWDKVVELCTKAGIAVGDDAPDFFVGTNEQPKLQVFKLQHGEVSTESDE